MQGGTVNPVQAMPFEMYVGIVCDQFIRGGVAWTFAVHHRQPVSMLLMAAYADNVPPVHAANMVHATAVEYAAGN